ncbi:unnamed protein product [Vicia faba]|uniref:Uncharacterized protein n=1 Tax=Vicia faba TaxID=3906 RepID=A0AAV1AQY6_VICFA|nr:unnamed protein product [Vicia faba]
MHSHLPQNNFSDKQQAKRPMPSPTPPQFPKKARTKFKASKETPDARVSKKKSSKSQIVDTLFHKLKHLSEDSLHFIGLNKKFNPNNVKHFYCNLVKNIGGTESRFKDKIIRFNYMDFTKYFGMKFEGPNMSVVRSIEYDRIYFVLSYSKDNPKTPLFLYSFMQLILEVNDIVSKLEDRLKAPKIMDYFGVSNMRYYRDTNGDYYYLEEYSQKVYDDKIMDLIKDPSNDASGSFSSLLFAYVKSYIDELVGKIFDNQIREERIMAHIDNMA